MKHVPLFQKDLNVTVESVPGSTTNFRFYQVFNGTKVRRPNKRLICGHLTQILLSAPQGYHSYRPENQSCGVLGQFGFIADNGNPIARDMQWKADCATGRMQPYYQGALFPSLGVELGLIFPIGSQSQAVLDCYRNMLSLKSYPDMYFVFFDWANNNVKQC